MSTDDFFLCLDICGTEMFFSSGATFSEISETVKEDAKKDLETILVEGTKILSKVELKNDLEMSVFWANFREYTSRNLIFGECTFEDEKFREKRLRNCSEEMVKKARKKGLEHQTGLEFYCLKCLKNVTLDSKTKISIHIGTKCHRDGILSALRNFIDTCRFLRPKMKKRDTNPSRELSVRVRTTKTRQQFLDAFKGYSEIEDVSVGQLKRGLQSLDVSIDKAPAFFCLCPYCDVKEVAEEYKEGLQEHNENVALSCTLFLNTLSDENNIVCVIDFAANIRSQLIENEQKDYYRYVQWSLFNLTVLKTSSKEEPEKYFDVITFRGDGKGDKIKHDSAYVVSALKTIFEDPFFEGKKDKNLIIWSDNGKALKSSTNVDYLSLLLDSRFASVSQMFFAPCHGKSICDRHFGCIARIVHNCGKDITSTDNIRNALSKIQNEVFIELEGKDVVETVERKKHRGISEMVSITNIHKEDGISKAIGTKTVFIDNKLNEVKCELFEEVKKKKKRN